jgi:hypothetical protein
MVIGTPADLAAARSKLIGHASTGKIDEKTMIEFLRLVRELGVSDPEAVCEYGSYVLSKCRRHLSAGECAFQDSDGCIPISCVSELSMPHGGSELG